MQSARDIAKLSAFLQPRIEQARRGFMLLSALFDPIKRGCLAASDQFFF